LQSKKNYVKKNNVV